MLRGVAAARSKIELVKYAPAGLDPLAFALKLIRFNQRLRSDAIQEVPIIFGLAAGIVASYVLDRGLIVLRFCKMARGEILACDGDLPAFETMLIPDPRNSRLGLGRPG